MNSCFKDHFSGHASAYAAARPDYPGELFAWLAEKAPACERAWDCATGNGQAAHWFDRPRFYAVVREVLRANGLLALWGYGLFKIDPALDELISHFYRETVGPYWPPERRLIDERYATLDFPFAEIAPPEFIMSRLWALEQVLAYLRTWSAVQHYRKIHGADSPASDPNWPVSGAIPKRAKSAWPLYMRVGYRD